MSSAWVLLSYRVPRQPSRFRLAIWRRLQRLGAVAAHDSVWILPSDAKTREDFEWIAEEVEERGGSALLWQASSFSEAQDTDLISQFRLAAEQRYGEIAATARALGRLARRRLTLAQRLHATRQIRALERAVRLERRRDYFRAPGREPAERALADARLRLAPDIPARAVLPSQESSHAVGDPTTLSR